MSQDGALLYRWYPGTSHLSAPSDGDAVPSVRLQDAGGRFVPTQVEALALDGESHYAILRFDSPLHTDAAYTVIEGVGNALGPSATFAASGPFADAPLAADVTGVAGIHLETLEESCCPNNSLVGKGSCLALVSRQEAQVQVRIGFEPDDSSSRQYLYRATLTTPEATTGDWLFASAAETGWALFTQQSTAELCYRVEASRLIDGELSVIAEGCVPAAAGLPSLIGPSDEEVIAAVQISVCPGPTEALRAAWCEVNRAVCTDPAPHPSPTACESIHFDTLCAWYPPSDKSLAELARLGRDAGVDPASRKDAGTDGGVAVRSAEPDAGPPSSPAKLSSDEDSHDCSAAPLGAATRRHDMPVLLVLFALMAIVRRRLAS